MSSYTYISLNFYNDKITTEGDIFEVMMDWEDELM